MFYYRPDLENLKQQHKLSPVKELQKSKTTNKENINLNKNKAILAIIEKPIDKRQPAQTKTLIKNVLKKALSNNLILPTVKEVKKNIEPVAVKAIINKKLPTPTVISKAPINTFVSKNQIVSCTLYFVMFFFIKILFPGHQSEHQNIESNNIIVLMQTVRKCYVTKKEKRNNNETVER